MSKHHPNFSLATICPAQIFGPITNGITLGRLNTSSADIYRLMDGSEKTVPQTFPYAFSDVCDIARAHLLAYESPHAAGQRFFVANGNYRYQQICNIIRATFPELRDRTPEGKPGAALSPVYKVDTSKAKNVLGLNFRTPEETVIDTVKALFN